MKAHVRMLIVTVTLVAMAVVLNGCSSSSGGTVYLNVLQRTAWQQVANGRLALASLGGNSLPYIYQISDNGSGLALLTPSFNQNPPVNVLEGGTNPSFSPDGTVIAFVSRRGGPNNASSTIYSILTAAGDRSSVSSPLQPLPDDSTTTGGDSQPNWSPDGSKVIYTSTRINGTNSFRTVPAEGGTPTDVFADGNDNQWPCYNPANPNQIVFQSNAGLTGIVDPVTGQAPTGVFILDTSQPLAPGTNPVRIAAATPDHFTDGAPSWSSDGSKIAFHSDRSGRASSGDFDIWIYNVADQTLVHVTNDARSDGYPVWNWDGSRIAFTRDRELWTCAADGSDQKRLTRRFQ